MGAGSTLDCMTTAAAGCAPCQHRARQFAAAPPPAPAPDVSPASAATTRWTGPLVYENQVTGEMPRRVFRPNSIYWNDEVLPLSQVRSAGEGHDGSIVVGKIEAVSRASDGGITGSGDFDMGNPDGIEAARLVGEDRFNWVSGVFDDMEIEVWVLKDLLAQEPDLIVGAAGDPLPSQDGYEVVATLTPDDELHVVNKARLRGATLVETNAISNAKITLDTTTAVEAAVGQQFGGMMPDGSTPCSCDEADTDYDPECVCSDAPPMPPPDSVTAAGIPVAPPTAWFSNPKLKGPSPLTVTDDGRVFGHLATFSQCHVAYSQECVQPPRSASSYAYFHRGTVLTADGSEVPTGVITLDTMHAGQSYGATRALAHYEDTGRGVADVHAGEDEFGIWVAGALRPSVSAEQVRKLRASPLSGDWRRIAGNLELVAALAVNVPGFPLPRPTALVAGGYMQALVAAGVVATVEPRGRFTVRMPPPAPAPIDAGALATRVKLSKFAVAQRHPVKEPV